MTEGEEMYDAIVSNYKDYVNNWSNDSMFNVGPPSGEKDDFPQQAIAQSDTRDGGFTNLRGIPEQRYLIELQDNLPSITNLPIDVLSRLPIPLSNVLRIQVSIDHIVYWKHTHNILYKVRESLGIFDPSIVDDLKLIINLILTVGSEIVEETSWEEDDREQFILSRSRNIAAYLCYPMLERIIKHICSDDVRMSGVVREGRKVRKLSSTKEYYTNSKNDNNEPWASLGALLLHLEEEVSDTSLSQKLVEMRERLSIFYNCDEDLVYGHIYRMRNTALHGQKHPPNEYGAILNLMCLLIWHKMKNS